MIAGLTTATNAFTLLGYCVYSDLETLRSLVASALGSLQPWALGSLYIARSYLYYYHNNPYYYHNATSQA